jgi:protein TonB
LHRDGDSAQGGESGGGQHAGGGGGEGRLTSPDASGGGGGTEVRSDWKKSYRRKVYSRIASAKRYPYSARRAGMEGKVVVRFTISRDGELISVSVVQPCEYSLLNSDALEWVRRAAPFPPFPAEAEESSMSFTYSLRYELTEP